jgi:hypothetical protein
VATFTRDFVMLLKGFSRPSVFLFFVAAVVVQLDSAERLVLGVLVTLGDLDGEVAVAVVLVLYEFVDRLHIDG